MTEKVDREEKALSGFDPMTLSTVAQLLENELLLVKLFSLG